MTYHLINGFVCVIVLTCCPSSGFLLDTTPTYSCVDHLSNCDEFNSSFGVCKDQHNAHQSCRKFCGLCGVVNGEWSIWNDYGICDVTCGNGTKTRTRQCNNPKPLNGGEDCQGPSQNNGQCILNRCPTHGAWSAWNGWGSCSVTCGTGLRRRDRACDNPWPSMGGNPCFGDNINYEICSMPVCATWTDWGSWSSCSDTCGYGLRERYRNCSGTTDMQNFCVESDVQNVMCKTSCNENRYQLVIPTIYFYARTPASASLSYGQTVVYTAVEVNEGQGYDPATGRFTVTVPGLYAFEVQLCIAYGNTASLEIVNQKKTLQKYLLQNLDVGAASIDMCASMQAFTKADASDQIWVKAAYHSTTFYSDDQYKHNSFSGALIHL